MIATVRFTDAAQVLGQARRRAQLSLRELGKRARTSHSTLIDYESGRKVPTVATFLRILQACGLAADLCLTPRVRQYDGIDRGEELEAVLRLAEDFPHRQSKRADHPIFGRISD
jgi:transcriptional regulator with XRE-family HTH domain